MHQFRSLSKSRNTVIKSSKVDSDSDTHDKKKHKGTGKSKISILLYNMAKKFILFFAHMVRVLVTWFVSLTSALVIVIVVLFAVIVASVLGVLKVSAGAKVSKAKSTNTGSGYTYVYDDSNSKVSTWRPEMIKQATRCGIGQYAELMLCIMDTETGGSTAVTGDIMKVSEAYTGAENQYPYTVPINSMYFACKQASSLIKSNNVQSECDLPNLQWVVTDYNYGSGMRSWCNSHGYGTTWTDAGSIAYCYAMTLAHPTYISNSWPFYGDPCYATLTSGGLTLTSPITHATMHRKQGVFAHYVKKLLGNGGGTTITDVPNYEQWKAPWRDIRIGNDTMHSSGCLVCSIADALSYKNHSSMYNPKYIAEHSVFTSGGEEVDWQNRFGFTDISGGSTAHGMKNAYGALKSGKVVICCNGYHYVCITGTSASSSDVCDYSKYTISDPGFSCTLLSQYVAGAHGAEWSNVPPWGFYTYR